MSRCFPIFRRKSAGKRAKKLENAGCSYVIFGPGKSIYSQAPQTKTKGHLQVTSVSTEPVVQRYAVVTLLWYNGSNAIIEKKWLRSSKDYDPIITIDENGKKHKTQRVIDPEKEISDGSPIGKALLGQKCGDKVAVADVVYEILKIEQKEIAEEP
ncbi:MAG: GreA/GreB family elongation factor [Oscillospiraceae bacterium]|nr:GreA/GreB family elongation factor [Oscillospiraceae bacterium]